MPKVNGFELAERIRMDEQFKNLPMIALSSRYREADVKKGLACGFNLYLEKLNVDQLKDAIANQLGGFTG
jgi:two-component system chemotaxis sensor kinase CheA